MTHIFLLPQIKLNKSGASINSKKIHIRQGDLDGACGPYSLLMALMIDNVLNREEISDLNKHDGRTRLGKFLNNLYAFGSLVREGTSISDLDWLSDCFKNHPNGRVYAEDLAGGSLRQKVESIVTNIDRGHPIILGLEWQGGGAHWCVAIGYEVIEDVVTKIFTLDPGHDCSNQSYWNGVLEVFHSDNTVIHAGNFSCSYWANDTDELTKCKIFAGKVIQVSNRL